MNPGGVPAIGYQAADQAPGHVAATDECKCGVFHDVDDTGCPWRATRHARYCAADHVVVVCCVLAGAGWIYYVTEIWRYFFAASLAKPGECGILISTGCELRAAAVDRGVTNCRNVGTCCYGRLLKCNVVFKYPIGQSIAG